MLGVIWTLFGNQLPHPPTFRKISPRKLAFVGEGGLPLRCFKLVHHLLNILVFIFACTILMINQRLCTDVNQDKEVAGIIENVYSKFKQMLVNKVVAVCLI